MSCTELLAMSGAGASVAGVSARDEASVSPPASLLFVVLITGCAPNVKPPRAGAGAGRLDSSGVFGGLPKLKPMGLPMLPVDPNPNGFEDELAPNSDLVGVDVDGLSPAVKPPLNTLDVNEVVVFVASFSSFELIPLKRLLEKIEGVAFESAGLLGGSPKVKAFLDVAVGPRLNADLGGAGAASLLDDGGPKVNVFDPDPEESSLGTKPPVVLVAVDDDEVGRVKAEKPEGGAGIVAAGLLSTAAAAFGPKVNPELVVEEFCSELATGMPPKLKGLAGGAGGCAVLRAPKETDDAFETAAAAELAFLITSSYSFLAFDLRDLYCSSTSAMSRKGSESTAFVMASTNDTLSPRRAR